jgi:hypothetical protein
MNEEQSEVIDQLRSEGYAIAIYSPEELQNADAGHVEDLMADRGQIAIEDLKQPDDEEV